MATGYDTKLTGAVGEFLVSAELCRRGLLATPFSGNVPHYDIIASGQNGGHLAVQVKTIRGKNWQFDIRKFTHLSFEGKRQVPGRALPEPYPNLQVVMVVLAAEDPEEQDRFYVLSWIELRDVLNRLHRAYLRKHGGVRPRAPHSPHVSLAEVDLAPFLDRWDDLVAALDATR